MRQYSKLIIMQMLPILLIVFFAAGCIDKLPSIELGDSASKTDKKSFSKANKKWQERLPIEIISIYPNQAGLARLYCEVENKSDKELEAIKIVVLEAKKKQIGAATVENVKPGQSQTFDIQTAVRTAEVEDPTGKVTAIRVKGKP